MVHDLGRKLSLNGVFKWSRIEVFAVGPQYGYFRVRGFGPVSAFRFLGLKWLGAFKVLGLRAGLARTGQPGTET